ncbi:MAG: amidase family protein [Burkholderiales bacterium]
MTLPTAHDLLARLDRGETTALALCEAAITAIEAADGAINAVVVRDFDRAREQARAADAARARGERRPLLGLPITVKEAFDVAGLATTWGISAFADHRARHDAVAVARLKDAGAVLLGKTNVATALADWQSVNPLFGRTRHPLDPARTPGGSSGGSAAALAAGFVALELGSDIGGSIRVPSAFCGLYGHKPSLGVIPSRGHAFPGSHDRPNLFNVVGPMARDADDLALAFGLLAGADAPHATGWQLALPAPRQQDLSGLRVLVLERHPGCATDAVIRAGVARVADALAEGGAQVLHRHPQLPDLLAGQATYETLLMAITTRGMPDAQALSAAQWLDGLDARDRARAQWQQLFEAVDLVVAPAFGCAAFAHVTDRDWSARRLLIDGRPTRYDEQLAWPGVATFAGLPATVVPAGQTPEGLPVGVQLIGPFLEDRTPLQVARLLARADAGAAPRD